MKKLTIKIITFILNKMGYKYTIQKETLPVLEIYSNWPSSINPKAKLQIIPSVMKCDHCQEEIKEDEEERTIFDGKDETITLCESCASHLD